MKMQKMSKRLTIKANFQPTNGRFSRLSCSYKNVRFSAVQGVTFRCNMWMLLIVKLLSFKRYNYPFYKCRENGRQMQCAYSQPVSDKVVPLLFSLYCKIQETNAMHCFSASSVSCVTERLSGCKDTDLYWIRANYYLKKDYSIVAFWITSLTLLRNAFCHHSRV